MSLFEIDCSDIAGIIEDCLKVDNSLKTIHSIFKNERYPRARELLAVLPEELRLG